MDTRTELELEFYKDIIITAVEGGINYWANVYEYDWEAGHAVIFDLEGDDVPRYELDVDVIARGVALVVNDEANINSTIAGYITAGAAEYDAGMIDAWAADAVVQLGLWGKVVYG